jgi:hypothetical protein
VFIKIEIKNAIKSKIIPIAIGESRRKVDIVKAIINSNIYK